MISKKNLRLVLQRLVWLLPLILLLLFLIIRSHTINFDQTIRSQLANLVTPVLHWQHRIVAGFKTASFAKLNLNSLKLELLQAQQKLDQLEQENIELKASLKYSTDIGEILEFRQRYNFTNAIPAQIIMKNLSDTEHYFYLDRGSEQGVSVNTIAIDHNRLIGRVTVVYPTYSKLLLVTDRACKIASYCVNSRVSGLFQGANSIDSATLKHVDHMQELINGDLVLSSGEGLIFPQGFALGVIKDFSRHGVDYDVVIAPAVDLQKLQYCLLLI